MSTMRAMTVEPLATRKIRRTEIHRTDHEIVRDVAMRVAEIAALPVQQETIALWKAHNDLKPVRPMVQIDGVPWHEMDVDGELTLLSTDGFCRGVEAMLRRTLYQWRHMRVDMVVEPVVVMPKVIRMDGFGIGVHESTAAIEPDNDVVSHFFADQLKTDDDVERIRTPTITVDEAATADVEARAHELFHGILPVRMQGWLPEANQWPPWLRSRGRKPSSTGCGRMGRGTWRSLRGT